MSRKEEDIASSVGSDSSGLAFSGATLEILLKSLECGIIRCGQGGGIMAVAGATARLLARDSHLVGLNLRDIVIAEQGDTVDEILALGRTTEPKLFRKVGFLGADGQRRELNVQVSGESHASASGQVVILLSKPGRESLVFSNEGTGLTLEDRLRAIADYGYDWEVLFGVDGKVLWVNPAVERITGYTPSECLAMEGFPLSLADAPDLERMRRYFEGAVQGTTGNDVEFRVKRKDGSLVWVAVSWQPVVGDDGVLQGHRGSIRDISLRKGAERELRENRRQLRTLLSNLPGMAYRCGNTIDWPMYFVSEGCQALTGYEPDDLTSGRVPYGELVHPEDRQKVWSGVQDGVTNERPFKIEYRIIDRNGQEHWVWEQGQLVRGAGGEEVLEGFITDITARVHSEQALRRSEEQFRALVEQSLQGLVILQGDDARIVFANPVVAKVTGYSLADLLTSSFHKLLTPESAYLLSRYHARLGGGIEPMRYEAPFRRQDGSVIWADIAAARILFHGEPAVQLVMLDITARKVAELELRRRDSILEALGLVAEKLLQVPDLSESMRSSLALLGAATQVDRICIHGPDPDRKEWFRCECIWIRPDEVSQGGGENVQTGDCDLQRDADGMSTFLASLQSGQPMRGVTEQAPESLRQMLVREGIRSLCVVPIFVHRVFWGFVAFHSRDAQRTWSEAELDAMHAVAGTLGAAVERSETRRALQQSEAYWRSLVTNLPNIVFIIDLEGHLTFINQRDHPDEALRASDHLGRSLYDYIRPEERERAREKIGQVMRTGETVTWEVLETGVETGSAGQWFTVTASPVRDEGAIIGVVGVMTDITVQKQAAEELLRSERRFRQIVEASPMGIHLYRLDLDGRLVFEGANSAADRILSIDHANLIGKALEKAFPPLAGTEVPERYRRAAAEGEVWETEQVVYEDERIRGAFQVVAFQVSPGRMAAMFLDVTERKQMLSALAESEERFRRAFQTSPDAIAITRIQDGVYIDVNEGFLAITGYSRDELVGKSSLGLEIWVDPADREYMVQELRERGRLVNLEAEFRRKDGSVLVGLMSASILMLEGKPYVLTIVRDIQELKETREALRKEMVKAQQYLDVAATIMLALDRSWRIRMINRKGADLLGVPEEELIGRAWIDEFVSEEDREMNRATLEKYLSGEFEGMDYYEGWVIASNGDRRLIAWYLTSIRDVKGRVESILTSGIDITDRRRMEDELRRTHEQLEAEHEALLKKNITLREVLNQIEGEKEGIKRLVLDNIETDILPTLQRLRAMGGKPQEALFEVLEDGLEQISSEFASGLKERFRNLTPRQLQICRLIKNGYTSKDIAESLGTSLLTVHKHREAIRDKLGLKNRNINLNSYLQSL